MIVFWKLLVEMKTQVLSVVSSTAIDHQNVVLMEWNVCL